MSEGSHRSDTPDEGTAPQADEQYHLRLYVAGMTPRSAAALRNLENICREHLQNRYSIEVIDLLANRVDTELGVGFLVAALSALRTAPVAPALLVLGDGGHEGVAGRGPVSCIAGSPTSSPPQSPCSCIAHAV